ADMWGDQIRWYVMSGPDLKDLRSDFLELTGKPLVPPKSLFGLWVSEFGYDNWDELKGDLASLRRSGFPVDGFGMDLQWFGAGFGDRSRFKMGTLRFDEDWFADAAQEVKRLREV